MPIKKIIDLSDFSHEKTFARLLDRACQLDELLLSVHNLRLLDAKIWNTLADQNISVHALIRYQYELFSIYYRSMFQASHWEQLRKEYIDPSAYHFDSSHIIMHEKIIGHVDKTLAHQDVDDCGRRYVYENINDEKGESHKVVTNNIDYHIQDAESNVAVIKKAIKDGFHKKFNHELKLLTRKE